MFYFERAKAYAREGQNEVTIQKLELVHINY